MPVTVKVFTKHGGRPTLFQSRDFDALPVTLGRDATCTMALDDPHKHISRVHVELEEEDGPAPVGAKPAPAPRPAPAPAPVPAAAGPSASMNEALRLFLEGAGMPHRELSAQQSEQLLRDSGTILRAAVEGLMMLLIARS